MSTFQEKLIISVFSATLFILVTLPATNCPTNLRLLLHTLFFFVLTYLSMWNSPHSSGLKLKFSIYGTLIFFFISSPTMFSFMNAILGNKIASANGCPTVTGVLLHGVIYCLALISVMYLPPELE